MVRGCGETGLGLLSSTGSTPPGRLAVDTHLTYSPQQSLQLQAKPSNVIDVHPTASACAYADSATAAIAQREGAPVELTDVVSSLHLGRGFP